MHTKEPWEFRRDIVYLGRDGGFCLKDAPNSNDNARRIVACVNACAGIPTEKLEEHKISLCGKSYIELEQNRDELLAALKKAQEDINWMCNSEKLLNRFVFNYVDDAIDKADLTQ